MKQKAKIDIIIVGGGIAGLWALNRLSALSFNVILLEAKALGGGQTLKSQGIIHGGLKYALQGFLNESANAVAMMPARWKACLENKGEIDLIGVKILSNQQYLWSTGKLGSEISGFFASKSLNSRVKKLTNNAYPLCLQNPLFKGQVYALDEVVLDTPSLIDTLSKGLEDKIFKINSEHGLELKLDEMQKNIEYLRLHGDSETHEISANTYLFTAGEQNATLLKTLPSVPEMQVRPLQMVLLKHPDLTPFYAHCIDTGMNPRITITSHLLKTGELVWYCGGQLAEDGIQRTENEQHLAAKKEMEVLFPWLDFNKANFKSFFINRAEAKQPGGKRPESSFVSALGNALVAWPTKLALAPVLVDSVIQHLEKQQIKPQSHRDNASSMPNHWPKPKRSATVWDTLFSED